MTQKNEILAAWVAVSLGLILFWSSIAVFGL
jgi:hypothetical protein